MTSDSTDYREKKKFFGKMLTIFGRNPVLEALQDNDIKAYRLHLAESNKPAKIISDLLELAAAKKVEVLYHDKTALSRISKNAKQDQGVALDIRCEQFQSAEDFLISLPESFELIAVDSVTNPQNLGMIIRSVCASPMTALLLPEKGCAKLDALVIKASAGTLFKAPIIRCGDLAQTLSLFAQQKTAIYGLDVNATTSLKGFSPETRAIYVLGNESHGMSAAVNQTCTQRIRIPMANGVESLNVSITASLLAFRSLFMV